MKRLATISMTLVFGTLTLTAGSAQAGGKRHSYVSYSSKITSHYKPVLPKKQKYPAQLPSNMLEPVASPPSRGHLPIGPPFPNGNGNLLPPYVVLDAGILPSNTLKPLSVKPWTPPVLPPGRGGGRVVPSPPWIPDQQL